MTRLQIGINDLATVNPELAAQWHPTKNGSLLPTMVTASSNKRIWWCGPCGHEWEAVVHSRTIGRGCPYCANKKVLCGFNDLATYSPEIAAEWNNEMNASLRPSDVTYGSHQKVWWRCKECGFEWQTEVRMRIRGTGCPQCANIKMGNTFRSNMIANGAQTLQVIIPPLGTHRSATRKTVIRIKERTNPKRGTHQSAQGTHLPLRS